MTVTKPGRWALSPELVAPEFRRAARAITVLFPFWDGSGKVTYRLGRSWRFGEYSVAGSWTVGPRGTAYSLVGQHNDLWTASSRTPSMGGDVEWSMFLSLNRTGSYGSEIYASFRTSATLADGQWFLRENGDNVDLSLRASGGWQTVTWTAPGTAAGGQQDIVVTRKQGGIYELFLNGVSKGTQTNASSIGISAAQRLVIHQLFATDPNHGIDGTFQFYAQFNRALSANDVALLSRDPYGLIRQYVPVELYGTGAAVDAVNRTNIIFVAAN